MGSPMYAEVVSSGDDVEILPKPELSLQERLRNLDRQFKKKKPYFQVKTDYEKIYWYENSLAKPLEKPNKSPTDPNEPSNGSQTST